MPHVIKMMDAYIVGFSNALAQPILSGYRDNAKRFADMEEAEAWAKKYLPGYYYTIESVESV